MIPAWTLAFLIFNRPGIQTPPTITPAERASALKAVKDQLLEKYVFPDMRPKIVEALDRAQKAGRYDVADPHVFAARITDDLRAVSHDHHLYFGWDRTEYEAALAPPADAKGIAALERQRSIRHHHGLAETKILPGNIRYLRIAGFDWVQDESGAAYDGAMRFLREGDAIVIDLRGNGGGTHAAVQYLVSHFLEPRTLEYTFENPDGLPDQVRALDNLPAGRLIGKPLYVLIDNRTGSAAEAFAYDVQQFKLGELVGSKTVGAANSCEDVPVAPGFIFTVSSGRPVHSVSHSNWEGVGISPTVPAPSADALDVAQSLALKKLSLAPATDPETRREYAWAQITIEARLHPVKRSAEELRPLVGRYGDIEITQDENGLSFHRPQKTGWPKSALLTPLDSRGLFAIDGIDTLRVRLTGKTLELLWADEVDPEIYPRT